MRIGFAFKIGFAVNLILVSVVGLAGFLFYNNTREVIIDLMTARLSDVGKTGSFLFNSEDRKNIRKLRDRVNKDPERIRLKKNKDVQKLLPGDSLRSLPKTREDQYMESGEFQAIIQKLRQIKEASRKKLERLASLSQISPDAADYPVIQYTYLLAALPEFPDKNIVMFLGDADYAPEDGEGGNPIGNLYKVKQGAFISAFSGEVAAEREFIKDEWGTWLTGAVPIFDENKRVIAILGIDYDVRGEANEISALFNTVLLTIFLSLIFGGIASYFITKILTKPIDQLRKGAEQVANKDFDTQINIKSKDELGLLANTFNSMVRDIRNYATHLEEINKVYFRFVPKSFLDTLGITSITDIKLGDQIQKNMTILFSDIRSFTSMSEKMAPNEVFDFINSYLSFVGPIIRKYNGFIDKYIGDAIMALFPENPVDALQAAIEMRKALNDFNQKRKTEGKGDTIDIGIGINSGTLMLGTVGEKERMETTVFADAVNTAARLESYTKKFRAPIIISEYTHDVVERGGSSFPARYLGKLQVRGKKDPVGIYQLFSDIDDHLALKEKTSNNFQEGLKLFVGGNYTNALSAFQSVHSQDKSDQVAEFYIAQCKKFAEI